MKLMKFIYQERVKSIKLSKFQNVTDPIVFLVCANVTTLICTMQSSIAIASLRFQLQIDSQFGLDYITSFIERKFLVAILCSSVADKEELSKHAHEQNLNSVTVVYFDEQPTAVTVGPFVKDLMYEYFIFHNLLMIIIFFSYFISKQGYINWDHDIQRRVGRFLDRLHCPRISIPSEHKAVDDGGSSPMMDIDEFQAISASIIRNFILFLAPN